MAPIYRCDNQGLGRNIMEGISILLCEAKDINRIPLNEKYDCSMNNQIEVM